MPHFFLSLFLQVSIVARLDFSLAFIVFTFCPYLLLFLVQLFGWLGVIFIQENYALFIKYALDMEALYPYVIAVLLIATIMWMPLWQLLMRRIGKKALLTVGLWMFMVTILSLLLTLGAHAQRGLRYLLCVSLCLCVCVCVCVCVSVSSYSRSTGAKPVHERYQRLKR